MVVRMAIGKIKKISSGLIEKLCKRKKWPRQAFGGFIYFNGQELRQRPALTRDMIHSLADQI